MPTGATAAWHEGGRVNLLFLASLQRIGYGAASGHSLSEVRHSDDGNDIAGELRLLCLPYLFALCTQCCS